jgi:hypothetical protein
LRVGERAPAGGDHDVTRGELFHEHLAFDRAEVGLAVSREDLGHRGALLLLDQLIDVHRLPVETLRQRTRQGGLSGRHEADEIHLVCFHGDPQDSTRSRAFSVSPCLCGRITFALRRPASARLDSRDEALQRFEKPGIGDVDGLGAVDG